MDGVKEKEWGVRYVLGGGYDRVKDSLLTSQPVDPGRNYLKSAWTRCSTPTPTTYMKRVQSIYIKKQRQV